MDNLAVIIIYSMILLLCINISICFYIFPLVIQLFYIKKHNDESIKKIDIIYDFFEFYKEENEIVLYQDQSNINNKYYEKKKYRSKLFEEVSKDNKKLNELEDMIIKNNNQVLKINRYIENIDKQNENIINNDIQNSYKKNIKKIRKNEKGDNNKIEEVNNDEEF